MTVRHVLLDADGVVQRPGGDGWRARITRDLGDRTDDFLAAVTRLESPALLGGASFPDRLAAVLGDFEVDVDVETFYSDLWLVVETVPDTLHLAASLRATGLGLHLATNQHRQRADHMKQHLGYEATFDTAFYSCDLGLAKPDPSFFSTIVGRLGCEPGEVLLVDDSHANVAGAREAALAAEHWHHDLGTDVLRRRLVELGLTPGEPGTP